MIYSITLYVFLTETTNAAQGGLDKEPKKHPANINYNLNNSSQM